MRRRDFSQVALLSASAWGLSVPVAHAQAKAPVEGKDYIMQEGDIVNFRFNV